MSAGAVTDTGEPVRDGYSYCWCHHVEEPLDEHSYIVCFECGHVWATKRDLRRAYMRQSKRGLKLGWRTNAWDTVSLRDWLRFHLRRWQIRADSIGFCQECIHDF